MYSINTQVYTKGIPRYRGETFDVYREQMKYYGPDLMLIHDLLCVGRSRRSIILFMIILPHFFY